MKTMPLSALLAWCCVSAGCVAAPSPTLSGCQDGADIHAGTFDVTWTDPGRGRSAQGKLWPVTEAGCDGGILQLHANDRTDEGSDHVLVLRLNFNGTPQDLRYAPRAAETPSFTFDYTEAAFWAGRQLNHVVSVDPASHVEVTSYDTGTHELRLRFHLDFGSMCRGEEFNCSDERVQRTVLDGATR